MMDKIVIPALAAGLLTLAAGACMAGSQADTTAGLKVCEATHVTRHGGTTVRDTVFGLRNPDTNATITIERIHAYGQDERLVFDSDAFGFPAQPAFTAVLEPRAATVFYAADITGVLAGRRDVIQVYIHYRLDAPGRPLVTSLSRRTRDSEGYEISVTTGNCRDISIQNQAPRPAL